MKRRPLVFIQGAGDMRAPDGSGKLAAYLIAALGDEYHVIAPAMPEPDNPRYGPWRDRIEQELRGIDEPVVLVGHSFGGSVLVKYLGEGTVEPPVAALFLVAAPFWGPGGWEYEEFELPAELASALEGSRVYLFHSRDDPEVPFDHLRLYGEKLPEATARPIPGSQHSFVDGLRELVDEIRSMTG